MIPANVRGMVFNTYPAAGINYQGFPNAGPQNYQVQYFQNAQQPGAQEALAQAAQSTLNENSKKRAYEDVTRFIEDAKRHKMAPVYDGAMAQRLSALQFAPTSAAESVEYHSPTVSAPPNTLPALRTQHIKQEQIMEQDEFVLRLQENIQMQMAQQQNQYQYRANSHVHSPHHQTNGRSYSNGNTPIMGPVTTQGGSQALTPPTSYTTSPPHSQHHTPPTVSPPASGGNMYPTLPAVSTAAEMSHGYPAPVSSAPVSSLAANFPDSRRYDVGVLRRANEKSTSTSTAEDVEMEFTNSDGKEISNSLIDPSLGSSKQQQQQQQQGAAPASKPADQAVSNSHDDLEAELTRSINLQKAYDTVTAMRNAITEQLMALQADNVTGTQQQQGQGQDGDGDHAMGGDIDHSQPQPQQQQQQDDQPQQVQPQQQQKVEEPTDEQALYPILRAVEAC